MKAKNKTFVYWSTMTAYSDLLDFVCKEIGEEYETLIYMLWSGFNAGALINTPYFDLLRIGDAKYRMIIQNFPHLDKYKVTIQLLADGNVNKNYTD